MTEQRLYSKNLLASPPVTIHDRLEMLQKRLGMDAAQFSKHLKISKQRYSDCMANRRNFQLDILIKLAVARPKINFNWLINGEGPMEYSWAEKPESNYVNEPDESTSYGQTLKACKEKNELLEELLLAYRSNKK